MCVYVCARVTPFPVHVDTYAYESITCVAAFFKEFIIVRWRRT